MPTLDQRQQYRNIERARKAIVSRMAREMHFDDQDLQAVADALAKRDEVQREYTEASREAASNAFRKRGLS